MVKGLIFAMLVLSACQTGGGSFCDLSTPIRLTPGETKGLSDETVAQLLAINRKGSRLCGWKK